MLVQGGSVSEIPCSTELGSSPAGSIPRGRLRRLLIATSIALPLLLILGYCAISVIAADILTRPVDDGQSIDPRDVSDDATSWTVTTDDGLRLRGWYYPTPEHRRLLVFVHGMRATWLEMANLAGEMHAKGYDVLLFDLRGHGKSDHSRLTMGQDERRDLRAILRWAKAQGYPPDRIGWVGNSMGASTLLMEGERNPEILAAVVDSPFGDLPELLNIQLERFSGLPSWFNPGILLAARVVYGVRTDDLIPIRSANAWNNRPLLLFHGEADSIVPVHHAWKIAKAAGPNCRVLSLPGVEHVEAYWKDRRRFVNMVDSFFQANLKP